MNRILVDTSAYSAFMRGSPEAVTAVQEADTIYVSPIVLGELQAGFIRGSRIKKNQRELDDFLSSPRVRVVEVHETTSMRYAVILTSLWKAGTPTPTNDIWMAATAMEYGLQVLTSDPHYLKIAQILVHDLSDSRS